MIMPLTVMTGRPPKLTPQQRDRVVYLYTTGTSKRSIARMYGVDQRTVTQYINGTHKNPRLSR